MEDAPLTSLCSICHAVPFQYRCPRCSVLTCSLPCIRRHKQWAQCSGLRDPAAYVKRVDLATPKMIDHDYNYLTSLEREFDKADRDADERGFLLDEISAKRRAGRGCLPKSELMLNEALERCGVIVARAPKGMSRSKANHTRWLKESQRLLWTVEWVHPDGRRQEGECAEGRPLLEAYAQACKPKKGYVTRKKRKIARAESKLSRGDPTEDSPSSTPSGPAENNNSAAQRVSQEDPRINHRKEPTSGHVDSTKTVDTSTVLSLANTHENVSGIPLPENLEKDPPHLQSNHITQESTSTTPELPSPFKFYLHAPSLPSKEKVLIPLDQFAMLNSSLRNRLVLEYPTIYVFKTSDLTMDDKGKFPDGFISEEDFFAKAKKLLVEEVEEEESSTARKETEEQESKIDIAGFGKDFDTERVLKVLGEDLKGLG